MIHIDRYQSKQHDELVNFLNNNWEFDTISSEVLTEKMEGDPNWNPALTLIAHNKGALRGFAMGVIRDIRGTRYGYIKLMAVDKAFRRLKIATNLYQCIEEEFKKLNVQIVRLGDVPLNYFMPGIDPHYTPAVCMALKLGFTQFGEAVNMCVDVQKYTWDTVNEEKALVEQNIEIRRAQTADLQAILKFTSVEWALWENEIRVAMADNPPSVHIALMNGEVKAFSAHNANNKGTGWFGPMGTHTDLRGKGVGNILLKRCLKDMRTQGYKHCTIPWVAPIAFYSHYADASISRLFWRFEKELTSSNTPT